LRWPVISRPKGGGAIRIEDGGHAIVYRGLGGACDILGFDSDGALQVDCTNIGFRSTWNVMLAGAFTRSDRDQLVLYDGVVGALGVVGFADWKQMSRSSLQPADS
jgi:hypothetical protein